MCLVLACRQDAPPHHPRRILPHPPPDIMPRLDPSRTPSDSTLPLTCQVTDLNVYVNEEDGYCFALSHPLHRRDSPHAEYVPAIMGPANRQRRGPSLRVVRGAGHARQQTSLCAPKPKPSSKSSQWQTPPPMTWAQVPVGR
ncbi:MAG: hypothetical protein MZU84_06855 [Sphingobacterium sp.]|nr:hypothetical protein [Sphingobacterium sp.]